MPPGQPSYGQPGMPPGQPSYGQPGMPPGQPSYGQPGMPPQAQAPAVGIGVAGWSGGMPRINVGTGDFTAGAMIAAVTTGQGYESPRKVGAISFGISFLLGVLNIVILVATNRYYPYLFIIAGPLGWGGLFLLITGEPQHRQDGSPAPSWARMGLGACLGIGLLLGIGSIFAVHI